MTIDFPNTARADGGLPVHPTSAARAVQTPIAAVLARDGFWGQWQLDNARQSIPHAIEWMHRAHYLDNLRLAAGQMAGRYHGMHWMDSELYKLLEAIAWLPADLRNADLTAFYDEAVGLILAAQDVDGYLNSYYQTVGAGQRWTDFAFGHEMYLAGHLIQAGVAAHRTMGDDRLLSAGRRFANHLFEKFGPDGEIRVDGHPEIEMALVELYRVTGDDRYLSLASIFIERRGHGLLGPGDFGLHYCQDAVPLRRTAELDGHAVRALYLAAGATDVAVETHDDELLERLILLWDDLVATKSYLTGGVGSRHFHEAIGDAYELPPDRAYCETCASIAKIMWATRLNLATGLARYAEESERVLYNSFAASTAADRQHFWYRNPLYQREQMEAAPDRNLVHERTELGTRASWFDTACCPPNVMRTIAALGSQLATRRGETLYLNQFFSGRVLDPSTGCTLVVESGLPTHGGIALSVEGRRELTVKVRSPQWGAWTASEPSTSAGGRSDADGYLAVRVPPSGVSLGLDLAPHFVYPDRRIDAITDQVAVVRGPVVLALEGIDLDDPEDIQDVAVSTLEPPQDQMSDAIEVTVRGGLRRGQPPASPYQRSIAAVPVVRAQFVLRPYAGWANRGPSTMRVWLPVLN